MIMGVRFCGGCNPTYDRGAMLEKIKEYFSGRAEFVIAEEDTAYDGILVLGGCNNCCASFTQFETKTDPVFIWNSSQEGMTKKSIERAMCL